MASMPSVQVTLNVTGQSALIQQVREEVARALRAVAAAQANPEVAVALNEVAVMVSQDLSHQEARERLRNPDSHAGRWTPREYKAPPPALAPAMKLVETPAPELKK